MDAYGQFLFRQQFQFLLVRLKPRLRKKVKEKAFHFNSSWSD